MKNLLCICSVFLLGTSAFSNASVLVVEGKYQQKNLYIQNGFSSNGVGFCAYEVKVNGQVTSDEVNSSAFEIDFAPFKFKAGDKITIEIGHKNGCIPKVLNPEAIKPRPTFDLISIDINKDAVLSWGAKNELGSLPYVIEQFKWNKWVYVGEVNGDGTPQQHLYNFKVTPNSGENKFRVKQVGYGGIPRYSKEVIYSSLMDKPSFKLDPDTKSVSFSNETAFEVYDYYGNVLKKGFGSTVDISSLNKGKYYLCYDNVVTEIEKRR
ncbi:MAG TPA: hypothetical protein VK835_13410 [Bacteroidia bacterium]|nr:hypothetical protein [Bacteroidia bacterium]